MVSDETIRLWWWIALGASAAVVLVVAVLLESIVRTARRIHRVVADIWTAGTHVAGNTVTIALLHETNRLAGSLSRSAARIGQASRKIRLAAGRRAS